MDTLENLNIRDIIPLLHQFGINPSQLGPEKIERLMKLSQNIKNPTDITSEISREMLDIIGLQPRQPNHLVNTQLANQKKIPKIGRNQQCPCGKQIKYKKCCGKC